MTDDSKIAAFSERQVERLTGLGKSRLRYWERSGFFVPSYLERSSEQLSRLIRVYSFRDIVALRTLESLRVKNGVSLQHLRKVAARLSSDGIDVWVHTTLWVMNRKVIFQLPGEPTPQEVVSGQYVMELPLKVVVDDAQSAVVEMRRRKNGEIGRVQNKVGIAGGPVVAGTRIRVASVKRLQEDGYSVEQIRAEYPDLTESDVQVALSYQEAA